MSVCVDSVECRLSAYGYFIMISDLVLVLIATITQRSEMIIDILFALLNPFIQVRVVMD